MLLYEFNNDKKNSIQSDLVLVILGFNYFLLNIYIKMIRYVVVSSSNFICCNYFSRSLICSQVTQRQV